MTVAAFHASFFGWSRSSAATPKFNGQPNEVPFPVPFREDDRDRPYDRDAVQRFHQALSRSTGCFNGFPDFAFSAKSSPVHLFWGSFDLAVTRFSGRRAPLHPGGIPALPDARDAGGLRPRGLFGGLLAGRRRHRLSLPSTPMPIRRPNGFRAASVQPDAAFWHEGLSRIRASLRSGAVRRRSRRGADGVSRLDLRGGCRSWRMGPRSPGMCRQGKHGRPRFTPRRRRDQRCRRHRRNGRARGRRLEGALRAGRRRRSKPR